MGGDQCQNVELFQKGESAFSIYYG